MKITRKGSPRASWEGEWSCDNCGCKWDMEPGDPEPKRVFDQRDGDYHSMLCPTCKREVTRAVSYGYRGPG